jgi:hypothetical protein
LGDLVIDGRIILKFDWKRMEYEDVAWVSISGWCPVRGFCEHGNETWLFVTDKEFND